LHIPNMPDPDSLPIDELDLVVFDTDRRRIGRWLQDTFTLLATNASGLTHSASSRTVSIIDRDWDYTGTIVDDCMLLEAVLLADDVQMRYMLVPVSYNDPRWHRLSGRLPYMAYAATVAYDMFEHGQAAERGFHLHTATQLQTLLPD